jgi:glycosyltransferase involved in cell wall biosynthesis
MSPEVSVVISTYNRERSLARAIESVLDQSDAPGFELIVVDNNCTDGTARIIHEKARADPRLRYMFERRQGVSFGRNTGIQAANAEIIAFTDDDVAVDGRWIRTIASSFASHADCGFIGGQVLPRWPSAAPEWLTQRHWGPLALLDYGEPQPIGADNRKCLITANMAVRRAVFESVGYFEPALQKTKGGTCSMEDREIQERYWRTGGRCWFDPALVVYAEVQPDRLTKRYHRRWHFRHGELNALLCDPELERSARKLLGVPGHILRRLFTESWLSIADAARGRSISAFDHEVQARFFAGFATQRLSGRQGR